MCIRDRARNALVWTRKAHIPIQLNLTLGFIGEDEESLNETESFVRATLPERLQIGQVIAKPGTGFTQLAIKNKWARGEINWKHHLTGGLALTDYEPFNLDLDNEIIKLNRILHYNPHWWINNINALIRNPELILPAIRMLIRGY